MPDLKLPAKYYQNPDTLFLARDLIGKYIFTHIDDELTGGMITETEAYLGIEDRACHAYAERRTARNASMYAAGGIAYVYLCYGIHALFNIVTHGEDNPHAILLRAIIPEIGIPTMLKRRNKKILKGLASGPGTLTQALGISSRHNATSLTGNLIWLEDRGHKKLPIQITPRIGIDYAGEDILKPYRFLYDQKSGLERG